MSPLADAALIVLACMSGFAVYRLYCLGNALAAIVKEEVERDPRAQLFEKLYADPESRKDIEKHVKRLFPNFVFEPRP